MENQDESIENLNDIVTGNIHMNTCDPAVMARLIDKFIEQFKSLSNADIMDRVNSGWENALRHDEVVNCTNMVAQVLDDYQEWYLRDGKRDLFLSEVLLKLVEDTSPLLYSSSNERIELICSLKVRCEILKRGLGNLTVVCDRCHKSIEGQRSHGTTSGFYDVFPEIIRTGWSKFARKDEKIICDDCMQGDEAYTGHKRRGD